MPSVPLASTTIHSGPTLDVASRGWDDVRVSNCHQPAEVSEVVQNGLVWWEGGAEIPKSIRDAIEKCDEMLLLFSPAAVDRQWVTFEIGMAYFARKRIVPILFHAEAKQLPDLIDLKRAFDINEFDSYIDGRD